MSSSIRISEDTKKKLEARKREGETFDELLDRLARTEKDIEEMGGFADESVVEEMSQAREAAREDWDDRSQKP